jgi:membrane-associated phospholipid phosphatase
VTPELVRWFRWSAFAAYFVALGAFIVVRGLPLDRLWQAMWILIGIAVAMLGRSVFDYLRVLRDWALFFAALLLYDHTRGVADSLGMPLHVTELAAADEAIFAGTLPTVWLQQQFYRPGEIYWYDLATSLVYVSHFFVLPTIGAVIYLRSRHHWDGYACRTLGLSFAGLLTYIILPAAPPWWAAKAGDIDDVDRLSSRGWEAVGLQRAGAALEAAQAGVNHVAALPSLHAAFSLLAVLLLWQRVRKITLRVALVLYPLAMAAALVYGGEHYVVDVLLGWMYAVVVVLLVRGYERWRDSRHEALVLAADGSHERIDVSADQEATSHG